MMRSDAVTSFGDTPVSLTRPRWRRPRSPRRSRLLPGEDFIGVNLFATFGHGELAARDVATEGDRPGGRSS